MAKKVTAYTPPTEEKKTGKTYRLTEAQQRTIDLIMKANVDLALEIKELWQYGKAYTGDSFPVGTRGAIARGNREAIHRRGRGPKKVYA